MTIEPTEKQKELIAAALSGKYRLIVYGGAIRGAKTYGMIITFLIGKKKYPGMRAVFGRKDMPTIERNTYPTFEKLKPASISEDRRGDNKVPRIVFKNKSELVFFGENYDKDKELNRWKGLETNWFLIDEINELQLVSFWKLFERCGSYIIPNGITPPPLIIATCNPTQGWVKTLIYDKWKRNELPKDWLYIPAKITDNPHLPQDYIESLKNLPRYEYEVFVNGNWDIQLKTGGEFLKSFELEKHVKPLYYEHSIPLHVSIDSNVLPYIAISVFQIYKSIDNDDNKQYLCRLVHEIPAKDPNNTAKKSAQQLANWILEQGNTDKVFIYGDPTTKNSNNIDDNKSSFFQLFTETLNQNGIITFDKMSKSNRSVSSMGDFTNAIFEGKINGITIHISEYCKTAINDYIETKQDKDGSILKKRMTDPVTKQSYEEHGHFTDNLKDFICQAFDYEFDNFQKGKRDFTFYTGYNNNRVR